MMIMIMVTKNCDDDVDDDCDDDDDDDCDDDDDNLSASESHVSLTRYRRPPHLAFVLPGHDDDDHRHHPSSPS